MFENRQKILEKKFQRKKIFAVNPITSGVKVLENCNQVNVSLLTKKKKKLLEAKYKVLTKKVLE